MSGAGGADAAPGLGPLRDRIDEITLEMVRLLKARTEIAVQIGAAKADAGVDISDARREEALRAKVGDACRRIGADAAGAGRLLDLLFDESVRVQLDAAGAGEGADPPPSPASVFLRAKRLEAQGRPMIHMEVGEPDFGPPGEAVAALPEA